MLIERFRVTAAGAVVFDQDLTEGVNVLEGENSSGKSTLFKLIYFGLGGALTARQWTKAALKCDRVYLQAKIGDSSITISRKVAETGLPPVLVFDGTITEGLSSSIENWQEYSYSRSAEKQSYSQLIFSALGMPEAFSEMGDFLTFNQFLRIHYADQDSPNASLLRFEDLFDKPTTRESVGNFVLGGTDQNLAELEKRLREAQNKYGESLASVSAGNILLGSDYNELSADGLDTEEKRVNAEIAQSDHRINILAQASLRPIESSDIDKSHVSTLSEDLVAAKSSLSDIVSARSELALEAQDSELFLATLYQRVQYLTQSLRVADYVGEVALSSCPACGSLVEPGSDHQHCYLCKADAPRERPTARYLSLLNATQSQIEQSGRIQKKRAQNLSQLDAFARNARSEIDRLARDLQRQKLTVSTEDQAKLATEQNHLGYLQAELDRIRRDKRVVERLEALRGDRDRLAGEIANAKEAIERVRNGAALRLGGALSAVSRETQAFLQADLDRQAEFHNNPHVEIDFRANSFSVNGQKSFSASSVSYLRNAIFLGILFAADKIASMRHLHILMLENLEDKGMEPERYHKLHNTIVDKAKNLTQPFQIIIATADLAPEVRDSVHFIGKRYTHDSKTLDMLLEDDGDTEI
ncbi:hypothetical protein U1737_20420 [Sphingomonas sp. LB3N6]|uniref:hypothetical protein n=1 Tax=Sphingomonas fucosidasi TaxID=3096164 RepID=UPI002FC8ECEF